MRYHYEKPTLYLTRRFHTPLWEHKPTFVFSKGRFIMGKLKDWWNEPITNGKIIKTQVKGTIYSIIGIALLNAWLEKKTNELEKDTVIYTNGEENNEG